MTILTPEQVNQLAIRFLKVAQEVGSYRQQQFGKLTITERIEMKNLEFKILAYSNELYTLSDTLVIIDEQTLHTVINRVTADIQTNYKTLKSTQKAIDIATSVSTLGGAIISQNIQSIVESISGLAQTWNG
ncbi:MAG TPA: hypothetical protein VFK73_03870 [Paludibacter sp.]|nr:hypothetical protein [Paludibacter sp.]